MPKIPIQVLYKSADIPDVITACTEGTTYDISTIE